jgi:hypothetical protein
LPVVKVLARNAGQGRSCAEAGSPPRARNAAVREGLRGMGCLLVR